ncbi:hypothetical protein CSUNSWCD_1963 [Campylobacter showae CSUNSWCD]|uniref:Uncharacterized protein n=1 Tax=Campylobacter showae CSUNSWCD TaxID=1244083 RepID=M5IFW5_9BACT|nr:hypothetical protein CSUNSWCD_1963 [Campylobacter showae CSUNSWCD]
MKNIARTLKEQNLARKSANLQAKFIKFILWFLPFCGV